MRSDFARGHSRVSQPSDGMIFSAPLPARQHRRRVYRHLMGHLIQVRDSLEFPYQVQGFPCGELLFESVDAVENNVVSELVAWKRTSDLTFGIGFEDIVAA